MKIFNNPLFLMAAISAIRHLNEIAEQTPSRRERIALDFLKMNGSNFREAHGTEKAIRIAMKQADAFIAELDAEQDSTVHEKENVMGGGESLIDILKSKLKDDDTEIVISIELDIAFNPEEGSFLYNDTYFKSIDKLINAVREDHGDKAANKVRLFLEKLPDA